MEELIHMKRVGLGQMMMSHCTKMNRMEGSWMELRNKDRSLMRGADTMRRMEEQMNKDRNLMLEGHWNHRMKVDRRKREEGRMKRVVGKTMMMVEDMMLVGKQILIEVGSNHVVVQ